MDPLIITIAIFVIVATTLIKVYRKQEDTRYRKRYTNKRISQFDLMMAADSKLNTLQSELEGTDVLRATHDTYLARVHSQSAVSEQNQEIRLELKELRLAYEQGDISLITYNQELDKLFQKISEMNYSLQAAG